ncbi:MAG TPA: PAS domain S-box protein [Terriglobia bacterium]|nr:PAS domain S-box protein [Terriglobia bacterium]
MSEKSWLPGTLKRLYRQHTAVLSFVLIGVVVVTVGAFVIRDLRRASQETWEMHLELLGGLDRIAELEYQTQEARRSMLYSLTTHDANLQVQYADESQSADKRVAELLEEHLRLAKSSDAVEMGRVFERDWEAYLKIRDSVVGSILEGNVQEAVQRDLGEGVPAFNRIRDDLQQIHELYKRQSEGRMALVRAAFNQSLVKLGVVLALTILFAALAARQVQRGQMLGSVQRSETRLREVIESINEGMFVLDRNGRLEMWNGAAERSSGQPRNGVVGLPLSEALPQLAQTEVPGAIEESVREGRALVLDEVSFSGEQAQRSLEFRIFPMDGGATVFFNDVTERKKAKEALLYEKHLLRTLMDNVPDPIHFKDSAGRFTRVNSAQARFLGADQPIKAIGKTNFDFFSSEDAQQAVAEEEQIMGSGQALEGKEEKLTWPDGRETWVSAAKMPLRDLQGKIIGTFGILHDITKSKQAEEELRTALQMKSDFVSFATHQLRTPLAGIKWLLELAQQEEGIPEEPTSLIQDARESAQRLIDMVNNLLDVSRLESGKLKIVPRETNLAKLTQTVLKDVSLLIQKSGHRVSVDVSEAMPPVMADTELLSQVVMNLVSNAVKYTPPGGKIAIRMSQKDGWVEWSVEDSGIGIPKASQARLFEKFFRAENVHKVETEGTGLGLCLVRLILERSGGRIWCESKENEGSTFCFTLPSGAVTVTARDAGPALTGGQPHKLELA